MINNTVAKVSIFFDIHNSIYHIFTFLDFRPNKKHPTAIERQGANAYVIATFNRVQILSLNEATFKDSHISCTPGPKDLLGEGCGLGELYQLLETFRG